LLQEDFRVSASNLGKYLIKLTKSIAFWIICLVVIVPVAYAKLSGSLSVDAITERLKPMGKINIEGAAAAAAKQAHGGPRTPHDIYEHNCKMCHGPGLAGAPKYGNKAEWAPRISQGFDTLVKAAWNGIRAMPPKGNCLDCSEDEIKATVEYMVDAAN
jgi:cytochrome c5